MYICGTDQNDARVARSLSSWIDVNRGGFAPKYLEVLRSAGFAEIIFGTNYFRIPKELAESLAATLIMYLPDVKELSPSLYSKIVSSGRFCKLFEQDLLRLSKETRDKYVASNILYFPEDSPMIS